ncbi:MAG: hypothetical protein ACTSRG_17835 [Candidatus Helarchaeota archaeon]
MNVVIAIFDIIRGITFYLMCGIAVALSYNVLAFLFDLSVPGKSIKMLALTFILLIIVISLDNTIYSIYHVHLINTKIALGAIPDPIF